VASSSNNTINTDGKLPRAFGAHEFAAGYGERYTLGELNV
jgi:hypothetical protein